MKVHFGKNLVARLSFFALIVVLISAAYPAYSYIYAWLKYSNGNLVVGLAPDYRPYSFLDDKNRVVGFDIDLAHEIAHRLSKRLIIKQLTKSQLMPALREGSIDLVINGLSITTQQLQEIDLIKYQECSTKELSLIFWGTIPRDIKSLADFANHDDHTIALQAGSWYEHCLDKYPCMKHRLLSHTIDLVMAIKHKECLAALVESDLARYLKHEYPKIRILTCELEENEWVTGKGIGISRSNHLLRAALEQVIAELKTTMALPTLEYKWFGVYTRQ